MKKVKPVLLKKYRDDVVGKLKGEFKIENKLAVPRLEKIVVNTGLGEAVKNKAYLEEASRDLAVITGQKPAVRKARLSVASFGVRKGMAVGLKVTLRGDRMYNFLDKLIKVVLPRLRDFRGVSVDSFDQQGNYTLGLAEQTIFPEVDLTKVSKPFGMEISIVTTTKNTDQSRRLLELLGMPFEKE